MLAAQSIKDGCAIEISEQILEKHLKARNEHKAYVLQQRAIIEEKTDISSYTPSHEVTDMLIQAKDTLDAFLDALPELYTDPMIIASKQAAFTYDAQQFQAMLLQATILSDIERTQNALPNSRVMNTATTTLSSTSWRDRVEQKQQQSSAPSL